MKKGLIYLLLIPSALLLLSGCGGVAVPEAAPALTATPEPQTVCFEMKESAAAPVSLEAPPTPVPAPTTPVPKATPAPKISDAWYQARNDLIARLMIENGYAADIDAANEKLQSMQIDPDRPMVALTFDDGPTNGVTDKVLDALEACGGRATFFVVGSRVAGSEALLKRAVSLGCEIGCHTFNHDELTKLSHDQGKKSIDDTVTAVQKACGYTILSLRPPTGENSDGIKALAAEEGMALVYWNHSTHDYRLDDSNTVAAYVQYDKKNKKAIEDGDIVLLHDLRKPTGDAAMEIVKTLTEQGYQLVTVQELLNLSDGGFAPGKSYKKQ